MATLDAEALYVALDQRRRAAHLQWRDVAREAHVSASTFSRMGLDGKHPSAQNLVRILLWLGDTDLKPYITPPLAAPAVVDGPGGKAVA